MSARRRRRATADTQLAVAVISQPEVEFLKRVEVFGFVLLAAVEALTLEVLAGWAGLALLAQCARLRG
jgi:hypothetical protein